MFSSSGAHRCTGAPRLLQSNQHCRSSAARHRTDGMRKTQQIIHRHLKLWLEYMTDMPVNWLKTPKVRDYFVWLRTDYEPRQFSGDRRALSEKTVRNIYITLSAFFTWAVRELNVPNLMQTSLHQSLKQRPSSRSPKSRSSSAESLRILRIEARP